MLFGDRKLGKRYDIVRTRRSTLLILQRFALTDQVRVDLENAMSISMFSWIFDRLKPHES